jgi:hypothetical protein
VGIIFLRPLVIDIDYERGFANDYCPDERFYFWLGGLAVERPIACAHDSGVPNSAVLGQVLHQANLSGRTTQKVICAK